MFHIETQQRFCGCEERESLKILQSQTKWTPEDFMTQHGKLWLGGVKSEQENTCAQMCLLVNQRTTHFTFESKSNISLIQIANSVLKHMIVLTYKFSLGLF